MFEGWVADLLATYLGKFIDVQKDQLGISLWSGGRQPLRPTPGIASQPAQRSPCAPPRRWDTLPASRRSS
jgi:hypothetical protein